MSLASRYPVTAFSETQMFLVWNPSTQTLNRVQGSDLVNYGLGRVYGESTRAAALNGDYAIGNFIQTAGGSAIGDGGNGMYLVVEGGTGDYAMLNGNDLLPLPFGSLAGSDLDGALVTDDGAQVEIDDAIALRPVQYGSMEAVRLSTESHDYIETAAFYEDGVTGGAKLYRDGTGTPTGSGAAVIAAALAADTFCNAAGVCYKLKPDQDITQYIFASIWDAFVLFVATHGVTGIVDGEWDTSGLTTANLDVPVVIVGRNAAKLINADDEFFNFSSGAGVKFKGVAFADCTAKFITGSGAIDSIEFYDCPITGCVGVANVNFTSLRAFKQVSSSVTDCVLNDGLFVSIRANIQMVVIAHSPVKNMTASGNSCTAYLLGNTQLANQPSTGNYFVHHNLVDGISASLAGASGEVHYLQLYGEYFEVDHNIIKNIHRNNGVGGNEGVEGIYLKMSHGSVDHNIMYKAGSSGGNKGAMINLKGVPLNYAAVSDTKPRGYLITCSHNVCDAGDGTLPHNGIRAEGDYLSIHSNRTYHCYYGILYAGNGGTDDQVYDVSIKNNIISLTTGPAGIWLNFTGERVSIKDNDILRRAAVPLAGGDSSGIRYTSANRAGVLDDISINSNKISGFAYGIYADLSGITCDKLRSQFNEFDDVSYAYRLQTPENATLGLIANNDARTNSGFFPTGTPSTSYFLQRNNYNNGALVV